MNLQQAFFALDIIVLVIVFIPVAYLVFIGIASAFYREVPLKKDHEPHSRFLILIPAHDEESVIQKTVERLKGQDYPANLLCILVVADYCSDRTADLARRAGALAYERKEGPRSGKGAALAWAIDQLGPALDRDWDAVVIFDADTIVDPAYLSTMDQRLALGEPAIQGRHLIKNPSNGWFPALVWAMFMIDNRFQNQGRANLGFSVKNMGDSICFRSDVLKRWGWGEGLTDDYQLRAKLLVNGIKIAYEPRAIGAGEAPLSWSMARAQRARWLRGTHDAGKIHKMELLQAGLRKMDFPTIDGGLQSLFPSYSTLALVTALLFFAHYVLSISFPSVPASNLLGLWGLLLLALAIYPFWGLLLERAPLKAYLVILSGPVFILWRSWIAIWARYLRKTVPWIRTQHQ